MGSAAMPIGLANVRSAWLERAVVVATRRFAGLILDNRADWSCLESGKLAVCTLRAQRRRGELLSHLALVGALT